MKKVFLLLMVMALCMSCVHGTIETKGKGADGATCKFNYTSAFKSLTEVKLTACHASGEAGTSVVDPAAAVLMKIVVDALTAKAAPAAVVTPAAPAIATPGVVTP